MESWEIAIALGVCARQEMLVLEELRKSEKDIKFRRGQEWYLRWVW